MSLPDHELAGPGEPAGSDTISQRQSREPAATYFRAFCSKYAEANRWHGLRLGGSAVIASWAVVAWLAGVTDGAAVGFAGAVWLMLARLLVLPRERRAQREGADAQELFDTAAFRLPWPETLAGPRPTQHDLLEWGKDSTASSAGWYPDPAARWPLDVVICQRESLAWARQDHERYARVLTAAWLMLVAVAIVGGVVGGMGLSEWLLRLAVPLLPVVLDLGDLASSNRQLSGVRGHLAASSLAMIEGAAGSRRLPDEAAVRHLQDGNYLSRRTLGVPPWLYRLSRDRRERNMQHVTRQTVQGLPTELRAGPLDDAPPALPD